MTFTQTPDQKQADKILISSAQRIMLEGGSGSGKTFKLLRVIIIRSILCPGSQHCIGRLHFNHVVASIVYQTMPMVLERSFPGLKIKLNKQNWFYELANGSQIWLFGYDQKERIEKILGTEWASIWINEASMVTWDLITTLITRLRANTKLVNRMYFDQNPPYKTHWTFKVFHQNIDPDTNIPLLDPDNWVFHRLNPVGNIENLPQDYIDALKNLPEKKRKRFWDGEYTDEVIGALWSDTMIDKNREDIPKNLTRIVIAIDPAVTHGENADDTGIIVAGKSEQEHYYILEDATGKYSPGQWASRVIMLYYKWKADRVIGESNNGGELVRTNINNADPDIKVDLVHASRGKMIRAEPVAGLYEQDRVHHTAHFPDLEEQQTHYTGEPGQVSPNNLDALVWAMADLMKIKRKHVSI